MHYAEATLREQLLVTMQQTVMLGLNRGASGNCAVRCGDGFLVTPSGLATEHLSADCMVKLNFAGKVQGVGKPSSEWRFHRDILQHRPEISAVVHTHSIFASTVACLRRDVPPFHYMIALAGGDSIRCAPYALFGTAALSKAALAALVDRKACLLANHGLIATGRDLAAALRIAVEVEALCEQYVHLLKIGEPCLLTPQQMAEALQQFQGYGPPDSP